MAALALFRATNEEMVTAGENIHDAAELRRSGRYAAVKVYMCVGSRDPFIKVSTPHFPSQCIHIQSPRSFPLHDMPLFSYLPIIVLSYTPSPAVDPSAIHYIVHFRRHKRYSSKVLRSSLPVFSPLPAYHLQPQIVFFTNWIQPN
ncbi:hypothetical protein EYC84_010793 [Monilinia fructicola]|uniref:Uncharacterized protein n=1 Tax=Monilinia fructicola TaxID=38448 RepID=A0A5M9J6A8_MONFR|nr:hypothetical protein EYC84_010793 [Monilinia fructicola]